MKIFILVDQLHSHGGIEKLVALKANYWTERFGYSITLISTEQGGKPTVYPISDQVNRVDLEINYYRELSFFHPKNLAKLFRNTRKVLALTKHESPDFILVASHIPMTYVLPFFSGGAQMIKEFHYSKFNYSPSFKEWLFTKVEALYDYLVVLSHEERRLFRTKNTHVIPNPVEPPGLPVKSIAQRRTVAVAACRFAPVKQIEKMIEAWELFSPHHPAWELHLYGSADNEYAEHLRNLIREKKLGYTILFKGQSSDLASVFADSRILLMTSQQECFPMVILEAQALGVPVVSFDSPTGPRNIIHDGEDGILVPQDDVHSFADALNELISKPESMEAMSAKAVCNAEQFHIDRIMVAWKNTIFEKNKNV